MSDDIKQALRDMFNSPLGEDATYSPAYENEKSIRVIYHKDSLRELGMDGYRIWIEAMTEDVAEIQPGESITVLGTTYKVKAPPEEGDDYMSIIDLSID